MAWVAREIVASSISTMLPAESRMIFPEVVVLMLKLAEVELILLVPAPAISMASPVPALEIDKTSPVEEE